MYKFNQALTKTDKKPVGFVFVRNDNQMTIYNKLMSATKDMTFLTFSPNTKFQIGLFFWGKFNLTFPPKSNPI